MGQACDTFGCLSSAGSSGAGKPSSKSGSDWTSADDELTGNKDRHAVGLDRPKGTIAFGGM